MGSNEGYSYFIKHTIDNILDKTFVTVHKKKFGTIDVNQNTKKFNDKRYTIQKSLHTDKNDHTYITFF